MFFYESWVTNELRWLSPRTPVGGIDVDSGFRFPSLRHEPAARRRSVCNFLIIYQSKKSENTYASRFFFETVLIFYYFFLSTFQHISSKLYVKCV